MDFGKRLKHLRTTRGLSQESMAKILNIHRATISRYENNQREPDVNTIAKIADYFEVSTDWLLGVTDIQVPVKKLYINSANLKSIYEIYSRLPSVDQAVIIEFMAFLDDKYTKKSISTKA